MPRCIMYATERRRAIAMQSSQGGDVILVNHPGFDETHSQMFRVLRKVEFFIKSVMYDFIDYVVWSMKPSKPRKVVNPLRSDYRHHPILVPLPRARRRPKMTALHQLLRSAACMTQRSMLPPLFDEGSCGRGEPTLLPPVCMRRQSTPLSPLIDRNLDKI